jgi:hypothetical protein
MKCAHGNCTCDSAAYGSEYCSPSCRTGIAPEGSNGCFCGHAECEASSGEASA